MTNTWYQLRSDWSTLHCWKSVGLWWGSHASGMSNCPASSGRLGQYKQGCVWMYVLRPPCYSSLERASRAEYTWTLMITERFVSEMVDVRREIEYSRRRGRPGQSNLESPENGEIQIWKKHKPKTTH